MIFVFVYVFILGQVSSQTLTMAACMCLVGSTKKAWWWHYYILVSVVFCLWGSHSCCCVLSAETAFYDPRAGAVGSLQKLRRHTLHRSDTKRLCTEDGWALLGLETGKYLISPLCVCLHAGKKHDVWFVVDPETGEKQTSLTTSSSESICPNTPLLYIGRTGWTRSRRADSVRGWGVTTCC